MGTELRIGFLGAGKMATALAKGFVNAGLAGGEGLMASDPVEGARRGFAKEVGGKATGSNVEVVQFARVVILAVKPDQVVGVLSGVQKEFTEEHLLISIAAGVPIAKIAGALKGESHSSSLQSSSLQRARIIRVMPNTPALVGASASAYALGEGARKEDGELAQRLLSAVGVAFEVKESLLDAVTGLSGSGPAYVYMVIEALSDGGVAAGLPRDVATRLAAQTVLGSAKMVLETGMHPGALKDMVTSPGGTTIEGLHELEKGGLRNALISAVRAATEKSRKLGQ
jgi:pyrroline-5-carboxylate reductase